MTAKEKLTQRVAELLLETRALKQRLKVIGELAAKMTKVIKED